MMTMTKFMGINTSAHVGRELEADWEPESVTER